MKQFDAKRIEELVTKISNEELEKEMEYLGKDINELATRELINNKLSGDIVIIKILPMIISSNYKISKNIVIRTLTELMKEKEN